MSRSDAELAARVRDSARRAVIVGGPRDGEVVPVGPQLLREAVAPSQLYVGPSEGEVPLPAPLQIRVYELVRTATSFGTGDALAPRTDDRDLDAAGGNRYVLRAA